MGPLDPRDQPALPVPADHEVKTVKMAVTGGTAAMAVMDKRAAVGAMAATGGMAVTGHRALPVHLDPLVRKAQKDRKGSKGSLVGMARRVSLVLKGLRDPPVLKVQPELLVLRVPAAA
jgi:hypothetical protein